MVQIAEGEAFGSRDQRSGIVVDWAALGLDNTSSLVVVEENKHIVVGCMVIGCMPLKLLISKLFFEESGRVDAVREAPCCWLLMLKRVQSSTRVLMPQSIPSWIPLEIGVRQNQSQTALAAWVEDHYFEHSWVAMGHIVDVQNQVDTRPWEFGLLMLIGVQQWLKNGTDLVAAVAGLAELAEFALEDLIHRLVPEDWISMAKSTSQPHQQEEMAVVGVP
jgi:hypothetical protein